MRREWIAIVAGWLVACGPRAEPPAGFVTQALPGGRLVVPEGFVASVYAKGLGDVRMMAIGPGGEVYASQSAQGRIVQLPDRDGDGVADAVLTVVEGLNRPHGLAFRGDTMYVAENHRVVRFDLPGASPRVVVPNLPSDGGHHTRTLVVHGDHLYVSVGSSCNICDERDQRRAAVVRYRLDGSDETLFATGLRNAVGLALHPETRDLWATNNDRDNLGDEVPPDRVNILQEGGFYGWPQCYLPDRTNPEYADFRGCGNVIGPAVILPAHVAPLGLAFYTGTMFPAEYRGNVFIALHGSWNRSPPIGYQVVRVEVQNGKPVGEWLPFASGWLTGPAGALGYGVGRAWGRPVDVAVAPDGALLISDDEGHRIYRIVYAGGG